MRFWRVNILIEIFANILLSNKYLGVFRFCDSVDPCFRWFSHSSWIQSSFCSFKAGLSFKTDKYLMIKAEGYYVNKAQPKYITIWRWTVTFYILLAYWTKLPVCLDLIPFYPNHSQLSLISSCGNTSYTISILTEVHELFSW